MLFLVIKGLRLSARSPAGVTVLIIPPFFISYIFKGDSYYALQKISYFKNQIQKEKNVWQNLLKSFQVNQTIKLKDFPILESLITEIFISKSIILTDN